MGHCFLLRIKRPRDSPQPFGCWVFLSDFDRVSPQLSWPDAERSNSAMLQLMPPHPPSSTQMVTGHKLLDISTLAAICAATCQPQMDGGPTGGTISQIKMTCSYIPASFTFRIDMYTCSCLFDLTWDILVMSYALNVYFGNVRMILLCKQSFLNWTTGTERKRETDKIEQNRQTDRRAAWETGGDRHRQSEINRERGWEREYHVGTGVGQVVISSFPSHAVRDPISPITHSVIQTDTHAVR